MPCAAVRVILPDWHSSFGATQGVMITAVIIKNVELPTNIREQMSGKTFVISSQAEQKMNQQSDMQQVYLIFRASP